MTVRPSHELRSCCPARKPAEALAKSAPQTAAPRPDHWAPATVSVPVAKVAPVAQPETYAAAVRRLEGTITAQVRALQARLAAAGVEARETAFALVLDPRGDGAQADELVVALELSRRAGIEISVVVAGASPRTLTADHLDPRQVLQRFHAAAGGAAAALDPATLAWLAESRSSAGGDPLAAALALAKDHLDRAPQHVLHRGVVLSSARPGALAGLEALWRNEGIAAAGLAASPAAQAYAREVFNTTLQRADTRELKDLMGTAAAIAVLESAEKSTVDHLAALHAFRAQLQEHLREDRRRMADAWFTTETREVLAGTSTERRTEKTLVRQSSPLVFDLDGKGIETPAVGRGGFLVNRGPVRRRSTERLIDRQHNVHSFHGENRFGSRNQWHDVSTYETTTYATRMETRFTQWVGRNTGLLVLDRDGDGIQAKDLFGDRSTTGRDVANGFEDLARLDVDRRGVIDKHNPYYDKLRIWRDANGNFAVDPGELLTLPEVGIAEIRLDYTQTNDPTLKQKGTFKSTRAVELEREIDALPETVRGASRVELDVPGLGTSFRPIGRMLISPDDVGREIAELDGQRANIDAALAALKGS